MPFRRAPTSSFLPPVMSPGPRFSSTGRRSRRSGRHTRGTRIDGNGMSAGLSGDQEHLGRAGASASRHEDLEERKDAVSSGARLYGPADHDGAGGCASAHLQGFGRRLGSLGGVERVVDVHGAAWRCTGARWRRANARVYIRMLSRSGHASPTHHHHPSAARQPRRAGRWAARRARVHGGSCSRTRVQAHRCAAASDDRSRPVKRQRVARHRPESSLRRLPAR